MDAHFDDLKALWLELHARIDQLAAERQQYLDLFEKSTEAYVITDAQGTLVDANGAAIDILQQRRRAVCGKPFAAVVALERRAEFRARLHNLTQRDSWKTVLEAPELRTEVTLTARVIERPEGAGGICWLLQATQ